MTDTEAVVETVTLPAWSIHLEPVDHPRPWRVNVFSCGNHPRSVQLDRAEVHLTEVEVAALADALLRPRRADEPQPGRAGVVRDGKGLLLRIVVHPIECEPRLVVHVQEHHRLALLDDIARHRPDLIPVSMPTEPRIYLDLVPVTGLTIDQAVEWHRRIGRWLDSEGIRAAIDDRRVVRHVQNRVGDR